MRLIKKKQPTRREMHKAPSHVVRNASDIAASNGKIPLSDADADPVPAANENAPTSRAIGVESSPSDISIPQNIKNSNGNILYTDKKGQEAAYKVMDILTDRYGAIFRTYRGDRRRNGFFDPKSGIIYINEDAESPMIDTVAHEFLHFFKQIDSEGYQLLKRQVDKDLDAEKFLKYKSDLLAAYSEMGIDYSQMSESEINDMVREEAMSDLMAEVMRNPNTIERIALENRTLAEKIIDCLKKMVDEIKAALSSLGGVSDPEVRGLVQNFDLISEIYQEVLAGSVGSFEGRVYGEQNTISYSITNVVGKKKNYGEGVYLDTDIFDKIKPRNWNAALSEFVYKNLAGKELTVYDANGKRETISFAKENERVKKDSAKNSHKVIDKLARTTGNVNTLAVVHIDELLQTSKALTENNEHSHQWLDENGWEIRKAYIQDKNGQIFETMLNIAKARDGRKILYALSNTKKVDDGDVSSASNEEGLAHKHQLSDGIIHQSNNIVNNNRRNNGFKYKQQI